MAKLSRDSVSLVVQTQYEDIGQHEAKGRRCFKDTVAVCCHKETGMHLKQQTE